MSRKKLPGIPLGGVTRPPSTTYPPSDFRSPRFAEFTADDKPGSPVQEKAAPTIGAVVVTGKPPKKRFAAWTANGVPTMREITEQLAKHKR